MIPKDCSMERLMVCELGGCPAGSDTELLVVCKDLDGCAAAAGVYCDFGEGQVSLASWDGEGQVFTCKALPGPQLPVTLKDASGAVLCKGSQCYLRQRCFSRALPSKQPECAANPDSVALAQADALPSAGVFASLSWTNRLLPVWILGAMVLGVVLGYYTNISHVLDTTKVGTVSLPIAIGLWLMMWPVLCTVRYEVLGDMFQSKGMWAQVAMSLFLNWLVGPLFMTGLAWAALPDLPGYRNGVILVGIARCIAMVLIWNQLAGGDAEYCAVLVAINSVMQILLYAPLALFYLKVVSHQSGSSLSISFWGVAKSVLIFLGAPLLAGLVTRYGVLAVKGKVWLNKVFLPWIGPVALLALVYTVLVLFGLQGHRVISEFGDVCRVAVPMLVYFGVMWTVTVIMARKLNSSYEQAVTQAFTASSNNFELAIAIAVGTFGTSSQEALAATIGPLIEVPVLLSLVYVALWLHKHMWRTC